MPIWPQSKMMPVCSTEPEPPRLPGRTTPLSLQHLFSSSIYAAQLLSLSQAEMRYTSSLLFLACKQRAAGNQKNKYRWKPCPMAVSLRRCPGTMDTRGEGTGTHLVQSLGTPAPNGPFAYLTPPWWPWLQAEEQPSSLCLLCTHFSQSTPFPCPCKPSGYPAMQGSVKDQDLWRAMPLPLVIPTSGGLVSGGSQLWEKTPRISTQLALRQR